MDTLLKPQVFFQESIEANRPCGVQSTVQMAACFIFFLLTNPIWIWIIEQVEHRSLMNTSAPSELFAGHELWARWFRLIFGRMRRNHRPTNTQEKCPEGGGQCEVLRRAREPARNAIYRGNIFTNINFTRL
jgi:hypothetical protein